MPGYQVEIDRAENRLYMKLDGMLEQEMADDVVEEITDRLDELRPGFQVINDISEFKPVSQDATDAIERGKQAIADRGVNAVVRIVGDSVIGKMQFDRVGDEIEGYHVATAESREQAERFLDRFQQEADAGAGADARAEREGNDA